MEQPIRLRLYGYWKSSSTWRIRIALHLKRVAWEYAPVDLSADGRSAQTQPAHLARNPAGQVPVLELRDPDGGVRYLSESMAIIDWLERAYPSPPLLPADPYLAARSRQLAEHVNAGIQPLQSSPVRRYVRHTLDRDDRAWVQHWTTRGLDVLERAVRETAARFCVGDAPSLADVYLVPQLGAARRSAIPLDGYPTLVAIDSACAELRAFADAVPDAQPDAGTRPRD